MGHDKPVATLSPSHSAVESIVGALTELESDLDSMNNRVDEMKKRLLTRSDEQVEQLKRQITEMANEEAKRIVETARAEAEAESAQITSQSETRLAATRKNIEGSFDKAVETIVKIVLGQDQQQHPQNSSLDNAAAGSSSKADKKQATTAPSKIKRYNSEGKPIN